MATASDDIIYEDAMKSAQSAITFANYSHSLRTLSHKVLEKVKQKKVTSFNEIAEEILKEQIIPEEVDLLISKGHKEKNIKRRVYDVLNVMAAMEMIVKNKGQITWVEPASNITEDEQDEQLEKKEIEKSIQKKTAELQQLILEQIAYTNLVRSRSSNPQQPSQCEKTVQLPFIAVRTSKETVIAHTTSEDKLDHCFNFDKPFVIDNDLDIVKRMGMTFGLETNMCSQENLEISKTMVPKELTPYLEDMAKSGPKNTRCGKN